MSLARDGTGWAELRVSDTGIGMTQETLGHIFLPFVQADLALPRTRGGLGLGLALVKGLTELHQGEVRAESAGPDKGACFTVRLRISERSSEVAPTATEADTRIVKPSVKVLVVEDNRDAADSLRDALALAGHEVEVAYTGASGLREGDQFHPDVVLCDIGLPG